MKLPKSVSDWISITGFLLAVNSLVLILVLFVHSLLSVHQNPYNGIITYILLPVVFVMGLLLIPAGMLIQRKRTRNAEKPWPVLDLNNPKKRQALVVVSVFTFFFLMISAVGSYEAFNYTESEYVTYLHSPHARVACVECRVGEGAGWYVKSKLSGLYQVYSVIFHKYPRPIATPIKDLWAGT
jgi:hypothetical protein